MAKIYTVTLSLEERNHLKSIIKKGSHSTQTYRNAYVLLNTDEGEHQSQRVTNEQMNKVLRIGMRTIDRIKKRFVEQGFEACLTRKESTRNHEKKLDGDVEAHLVALSCGQPPEGFGRWSLRMLADKMVSLEYVESISHESVRQLLKKRIEALAS